LAGDSNWLLTPPLTISLAGPRQMLAFSLVHVSAWTKGWYKTQSKNISSSILTPQLIPWYTSPLRSDVHQHSRYTSWSFNNTAGPRQMLALSLVHDFGVDQRLA